MELGLEHGLKRLLLFRVVMVTTLLLVAISVESVSETLGPINPLYWLIAATYGLTILYVLALRALPIGAWQLYIQVLVDLALTTALVYMSGGTATRGGFVVLYPIVVLAGSVLLRRRDGLLLAGLATVFYAGLLWGAREGWARGYGLEQVRDMPARQVLYPIFVTGVSCATVALVGTYLSESLQSAGDRLEEASEQVADLRELNRTIVESIQSGLVIADAGGRLLFLNQFGERMLGRRNAEVRGMPLPELFRDAALEPAALAARAASRSLSRMELVYNGGDGPSRELGLSVSPLATAAAPQGGYLVVFQDLSPIKRLEQEARTNEKLAAVGEMASQLAHEIRNPLGSISGSAQVLMGGAGLPAEQIKLLEIITKESRRLSDTLNRFLFQVRPGAPTTGWTCGRRPGHTSAWRTGTRSSRSSGTWCAMPWRPCRTVELCP
jgi:two-component system sensor histidine kinase PilS (NtrC family)